MFAYQFTTISAAGVTAPFYKLKSVNDDLAPGAFTGAEWHMARKWPLMSRFEGEFCKGDKACTGKARLPHAW